MMIYKSMDFYTAFLQEEPYQNNADRWVSYRSGISLFDSSYDKKLMKSAPEKYFNEAYIREFRKTKEFSGNNTVIFNFMVDDLKAEYERLARLNIGRLSDLMYVNIAAPYWYFNLYDPDGNILEITGNYSV